MAAENTQALEQRYPLLSHVSAQRRFLRPENVAKRITPDPQDTVDDLVVVGHDVRRFRGEEKAVMLLAHPAVPGETLMAIKATRTSESASEEAQRNAADLLPSDNDAGEAAAAEGGEAEEEETGDGGDVIVVGTRDDGFYVCFDDDEDLSRYDEPPQDDGRTTNADVAYEPWGDVHVNIAPERATMKAKVKEMSGDPAFRDPLCYFFHFFPPQIIRNVVDASNAAVPGLNLSNDELFAWLGALMVASNFPQPARELWSSSDNNDDLHPLPFLSNYMRRRRFEQITGALRLYTRPWPSYDDPFHPVREVIEEWNNHMEKVFLSSHTVCLDESMVVHNNERVPGFMTVKRKPHPLGNEYHTICDGETCIMFKMELVEGKSRPQQRPLKYEAEYGKTASLVIRMTEELSTTGRVVVMDSAFCVMSAIYQLYKRGLYTATVAKKRAYWPRGIPGDEVNAHMAGKPVGELHTRKARMHDMPLLLFAVNHSLYTFILISTYGCSHLVGPERKVRAANGAMFTYRRNEAIQDYYAIRHAVDDHNHLRQGQRVGLERAWASKFWPNRQFAFLVSVSLVNAMLAYNHFTASKCDKPLLNLTRFKRHVETGLLRRWKERDTESEAAALAAKRPRRSAAAREHRLVSYEKYQGATGKKLKKPYQQVICKGAKCSRQVRTHCTCSTSLAFCVDCFLEHRDEERLNE